MYILAKFNIFQGLEKQFWNSILRGNPAFKTRDSTRARTWPETSLGHQEGRRVFRGQIFWTVSNSFKLRPTHFSRWPNSRGYEPGENHYYCLH